MADRILVVDDEEIIRDSMSFVLNKEGFTVVTAADGNAARQKILEDTFDMVITDLEMPGLRGIELLDVVMSTSPQTSVMIVTAYGSLETAIAALRKGASDYILKPVEFDDLILKVRHLLSYKKLAAENQILRRELHRELNFSHLVGNSQPMQKVFEIIKMVAPTASTVLITGKSGTGKELVARALHFNSLRNSAPFVVVNCGAIPETLIESELFGHKKGSFTGAVADKTGFFKAADGGTLCLDEISEMPLALQVKLLRAIEQKEISPVGMSSSLSVDVRIIASTNRDLRKEVEAGRFREDLFYRLNVVEIHLPSLSERRDDIPLLVEHFLQKYRTQMRKDIKGMSSEVMHHLVQHEWKGEIRELENIIERAVIFCKGDVITLADLPEFFEADTRLQITEDGRSLEDAMNDMARHYISMILRRNKFDKEKAAAVLKISLPTLYRRIKELNITEEP